ncbi:MAG: sporulation transcription factor Spo0A [Lachnospiraceae bacterium]|nr:sporulation transcription factor Spo0A [Lachnospiraceae bacterium]
MEKIKVLVVDDVVGIRDMLISLITSDPKLEVAGEAEDGRAALQLIEELRPDVMLLDVIMPRMDGLELLQELKDIGVTVPVIIVISAAGGEKVVDKCFRLGASYFIKKPFDGESVLSRIHQLTDGERGPEWNAGDSGHAGRTLGPVKGQGFYNYHNLESDVTVMLQKLGIPPHVKGYQFLRDGIMIAVENPEAVTAVTKMLYPTVAAMNHTIPDRVERSIRHAVSIAWEKDRGNVMLDMFNYSVNKKNGRPTNAELIALISDKIRVERRAKRY